MSPSSVATVCHETNRAFCVAIGDNSQPTWEEAPAWQKESAIAGVIAHLANPNLTGEQSHELWLEHKRKEGWTYGPIKDPGKKQHPCFVPYGALPVEQRAKDALFKGVVDALRSLV